MDLQAVAAIETGGASTEMPAWLDLFGKPRPQAQDAADEGQSSKPDDAPSQPTHTIECFEGMAIVVTAARVSADVWDDPARLRSFIGPQVPGISLSEESREALRAFLQSEGTEAVSDGTSCYTLIGDRLVYCFPERYAAAQVGRDAEIDCIAAELQKLYDGLFEAQKRRIAENQIHDRQFARMSGIGAESVEKFAVKLDPEDAAKDFLRGLISEKGRALLGLHPSVVISASELHEQVMAPFNEARERRRRHYQRDNEIDSEGEKRPEFNVLKACRWLAENYSGEAGERARYQEVADQLYRSLGLQSKKFELRNGRVEIDIMFRCEGYSAQAPTWETQSRIAKKALAFAEVYRERGEDPPAALTFFSPREVSKNSTYEWGPHLKLRTHVSTAKVIMTETFANWLREFIATYHKA